jgi:hypothetical protein
MGETNVGGILATLRLSITDFETNIAKAQEMADRLDGKNVVVNVKVDTGGAETKLAAVAASEDRVGGSSKGASSGLTSVESAARKLADASSVANIAQLRLSEVQGSGTAKASSLASANQSVTKTQRDLSDLMKSSTPEVIRAADAMKNVDDSNTKVAKSSKEASNGLGLMSMAIVGLGPAIVPLAAGAAGLAVGFGAMGAAGILAIVGISREMKAGTPLGGAYTSMLGTLSGDLTTLGHTAAAGVLGPFQAEVANLQGQMPQLNSIIGEFSVITGKTAANLISGLVQAFITLEPLARDVGVYVLDLSSKFAAAMSGPGVVSFGDYIRSVFPQIMQTVESVVTAAVHLIAALAPLGLGTLGMLKLFTDAINAIPVDVLSNLATVAAPIFVGFKAFGVLSAGVTAFGTALGKVGVSAETAATGMRAMNIAAGAIGILLAVVSLAFTAMSGSSQQATQAANDYADALRQSNGVIDENVRQQSLKSLSDSGALAAARELGYSLSDVAKAALGAGDAQDRLDAHTKVLKQSVIDAAAGGGDFSAAMGDMTKKTDLVTGATRTASGELATGTQKYKDMAAATATTSTAAGTMTTATLLGMTAQQQSESSNKSQIATIKTLNATMDEEISRELTLAGATSNLDQATLTMTETLKKNKLTMDEHTQAGIDDRRAIEGVVGSLQSQRTANINAGDSTAVATTKYQAASAALLDQTGKMYGTTSQAYKYMKQLLAIPPTVKTDLGITGDAVAKDKISQVQTKIDHLVGGNYAVNVAVNFTSNSGGPGGTSLIPGIVLHAPGGAMGGEVTGGVPGKDSVLRTLMPKEYIIREDGSNLGAALAYYGVTAPGMAKGGVAAGGPLGISPLSQLNSLKKVLS